MTEPTRIIFITTCEITTMMAFNVHTPAIVRHNLVFHWTETQQNRGKYTDSI